MERGGADRAPPCAPPPRSARSWSWTTDPGTPRPRRARRAGARVLTTRRNLGKGAALAAGVAALPDQARYVLFLDADLEDTAANAAPLVEAVRSGRCDMAIALPPPQPGGGHGLVVGLARDGNQEADGLRGRGSAVRAALPDPRRPPRPSGTRRASASRSASPSTCSAPATGSPRSPRTCGTGSPARTGGPRCTGPASTATCCWPSDHGPCRPGVGDDRLAGGLPRLHAAGRR